jgi:hypothetical protein
MNAAMKMERLEPELALRRIPDQHKGHGLHEARASAVVLAEQHAGRVERDGCASHRAEVLDPDGAEQHCARSITEADVERARDQNGFAVERHKPQLRDGVFQRHEIEPGRVQRHHHTVHAVVQRIDRSRTESQSKNAVLRIR